VLIDGRNFWRLHGRWLAATAIAAALALGWTVLRARHGGRWPGGGSLSGLTLGIVAAAIFAFELALWAKKTKALRTARWTLSAQAWMKAHIWLGLLTVPLVFLHSGGRVGGVLTVMLLLVYGIVIASGLWGLLVQNVLPRLLLEAAPAETVFSQIDRVGRQYAEEARRLVVLACGEEEGQGSGARGQGSGARDPGAGGQVHGAARRVGVQVKRSPQPAGEMNRPTPSAAVQQALAHEIGPFLEAGAGERGALGSRQRNGWYFDDLRLRVPAELRTLVEQLEELCERRRQLDLQRRVHFWLHNWLWLHLPLSITLMVLLVGHIVFALRFG
jgi:hypothetical protein